MKAREISYAGLMGALSIIFLFFASVLPKGNSLFYILSSVCIMIIVWLYSIKLGFVAYIVVSLLSLMIVPNKLVAVLYILIFGLYPLFKAICERGFPVYIELGLKLLFYNVALIILYFVFKIIMKEIPNFKFGIALTIASSEVIFVLYDYLLTLILQKLKSLKIPWRGN
ncbi:hypothetical protein ELD05_09990 [Caldicellulosiruptor changbaiensis]|uniref:DUF2232 domain-containing protein n=2 Tax=Caldicellulosiruptor changbaiensis TaxID=1222016 RepID=A0A3T0D768_9FIRM|nr:hypothetical protein [Caldicellulosiruptor changbaiensis]AZT90945.1 hypothetical protein ELD05_09990 [Caldicellulosiruptor changbaiensis]